MFCVANVSIVLSQVFVSCFYVLFQHCGSPYSHFKVPFLYLFFNMVCFKLPSSIKCALTVAMSVKKMSVVCVWFIVAVLLKSFIIFPCLQL